MIFSPNCWEKVFFFYSAYLHNCKHVLMSSITYQIKNWWHLILLMTVKWQPFMLINWFTDLLSFNSGHTNIAIWSVWECTFEHLLLHKMLNVHLLQILSGLLRCKSYQRNLSYLNCQNHFFLKRFKVQFR